MVADIFATCMPGQEKTVISNVRSLPDIVEVNGIMGRYDIFIKVDARDERVLHAAIANVRKIQPITSTLTFPVIRGQGGITDDEK